MAPEVEFCLLGPLLVRQGGMVVAVPSGKQRALLAALLLNANRVVPLGELVDALWGPGPPVSARKTAQNYVKRLRRSLGVNGRSLISTQLGGYLIRLDPRDPGCGQVRVPPGSGAASRQGWLVGSGGRPSKCCAVAMARRAAG